MDIELRVLPSRVGVELYHPVSNAPKPDMQCTTHGEQCNEIQSKERDQRGKELLHRRRRRPAKRLRGLDARPTERSAGGTIQRFACGGEFDRRLHCICQSARIGAFDRVDGSAGAEDHESRHARWIDRSVGAEPKFLVGRATYAETPYCWAICCWESTSTLAKVMDFGLEYLVDSDSKVGAMALHGPHQSA
jgi:hypothetical protein